MTPKTLRFCPGCQQCRLQMNASPCEICGRVNPVTPPKSREKMHISAKILRALLRPLGGFAHLITAAFCGFALWALALRQILPFFSIVEIGLTVSWALAAGIWAVRLATRGLVWQFAPATRQSKRSGARTFLVLPMCLALLWGLNRFNVPLQIAFRLSLPGLTKMSFVGTPNRFQNLTRFLSPARRAGLYNATRFDVNGPNVRIKVTDNNFLWNDGTSAGFAYCPQGGATVRFPPAYMRSEPPKYIQLSRDWFWWEESGTDD